ncbi:MAG TPA: PLP-dependent aminotransferase family protein [Ktedonobacterales bacterium]
MQAIAQVPVALDRESATGQSLARQIYSQLRAAIVSGELRAGSRLPPTRVVAAQLGVARLTVATAYDWLREEGFVYGRVGAGTFVAPGVDRVGQPGEPPSLASTPAQQRRAPPPKVHLSAWAERIAGLPLITDEHTGRAARFDLRPGVGAAEKFPWPRWRQYVTAEEATRRQAPIPAGRDAFAPDRERVDALLGPHEARHAIAAWLWRSRAVRCDAAQVMIASSVQQVLTLLARLLIEPGEPVLIENPSYVGFHAAFEAEGAVLDGVVVDAHGLRTDLLPDAHAPRLAIVTPSHQYPTGVTLALERRVALLQWARAMGTVIIEDDYDGELRLEGQPLEALRGLDDRDEVIYIGTLAKAMYPAVRLAYAVLPGWLVELVARARATSERHPIWHEAHAVGRFIADGELERHLARVRRVYRSRRDALLASIRAELDGLVMAGPADAGIHLLGRLADGVNDLAATRAAAERGVLVTALSPLYRGHAHSGLLLGFGALAEEDATTAMRALGRAIALAML